MNLGKTFRSRFDMGLHQLQDTAGQIESAVLDQTTALAEQTRKSLIQGKKAVWSWEKSAEESIRTNPTLYASILLGVIGLLLAKMFFDRKH